jgi:drug/metabolite transporter (DMT)-like permease
MWSGIAVYALGAVLFPLCEEHVRGMPWARPAFLSALNAAGAALAMLASAMAGGRAVCHRKAPLASHLASAAIVSASLTVGWWARGHVPASLFITVKSLRLISTMVVGRVWLHKRYLPWDWAGAGISIAGLVLLLLQPGASAGGASVTSRSGGGGLHDFAWGVGAALASLLLDGVHSNLQEQVMRQHGATPGEMVLWGQGMASVVHAVRLLAAGAAVQHAGSAGGPMFAGKVSLWEMAWLAAYAGLGIYITAAPTGLIALLGAGSFSFLFFVSRAAASVCLMLAAGQRLQGRHFGGLALIGVAVAVIGRAEFAAMAAWAAAWYTGTPAATAPEAPPVPNSSSAASGEELAAADLAATAVEEVGGSGSDSGSDSDTSSDGGSHGRVGSLPVMSAAVVGEEKAATGHMRRVSTLSRLTAIAGISIPAHDEVALLSPVMSARHLLAQRAGLPVATSARHAALSARHAGVAGGAGGHGRRAVHRRAATTAPASTTGDGGAGSSGGGDHARIVSSFA